MPRHEPYDYLDASIQVLREVMESQGLGPNDMDHRIELESGKSFNEWAAVRDEITFQQFFFYLGEALSAGGPEGSEPPLPRPSSGTSTHPLQDGDILEAGLHGQRPPDAWTHTTRLVDLVESVSVRLVEGRRIPPDALIRRFRILLERLEKIPR